ncbi:hypothetical protein Tco_1333910 [Tanacetum coccineum]
MAEEQDEQQQQQNMLDAALVLINEQVNIAVCNFRIALEKTQPDVIYTVCLEILKQYSFYNALIATADALEIYMQQFWYTITYDLTAQAYFFTMGDQDFEVNADVLRNALSIKVLDHPFALPAPEKEIIKFIKELGCPKSIKTISALRFANKGTIDPIFGMAILAVMLNDNIKASAEIITEEFDQSKQIDDQGDSEETEKDEEPLIRRQTTGIIFSKEVRRYPDEERVDHSMKVKGLEALFEAAQLKVDLKKARKASKDNFC